MPASVELGMSPEMGAREDLSHPELHDQYPERILKKLSEWEEYPRSLEKIPDDELEVLHGELSELEEEHLSPHRVTLDGLQDLPDELEQTLAEVDIDPAKKRGFRTRLQNVLNRVEDGIHEYGSTVRQHVIAATRQDYDPDGARRLLDQANRSRSQVHDRLIDSLQTLNALCFDVIPAEAHAGKKTTPWREFARSKLFLTQELRTEGEPREKIGAWALDMDIVERARTVDATVEELREKKKADTHEGYPL